MPIILVILALTLLKYFEVWRFTEMSWWYVIGLSGVAFIWFEFAEPILGLDKRRAHDEQEKIRKERVKQTFEKPKQRK